MRRQHLLRASSAQSLCIFCQCRLTGELSAVSTSVPLGTSRRRYNTSQRPRQTVSATAEAPAESDHQAPPPPKWTGFDPSSSLSASEQRERALLQQRQQEQLQKDRRTEEQQRKRQQEAADAFARQREAERKADEAQRRAIQDQWRAEQRSALKQQSQSVNIRKAQVSGGNPIRKHGRQAGAGSRVGDRDIFPKSQDTRQGAQKSERQGYRDVQATRQPQVERRSNPFATPQQAKHAQAPAPQRMPLPEFGGGTRKAAEPERSSAGGWGSGRVERAPLMHEGDDVPPDFVPQAQYESPAHKTAGSAFELPNGMPRTTRPARRAKEGSSQRQEAQRDGHQQQSSSEWQVSRGDGGYHATILDSQSLEQDQAPFDDSHTAEWQHLRRKDVKPEPPPVSEQRQQQPAQQQYDEATIDRIFNEHRAQRPQTTRQQDQVDYTQYAPKQSENALNVMRPGERRCGRCGNLGHAARDCNGPIRSKCNICGQVGHFSRTCPQNTGDKFRTASVRRPVYRFDAGSSNATLRTADQQNATWRPQSVFPSIESDTAGRQQQQKDDVELQHHAEPPTMERRPSAIADLQDQVSDASTPAKTEVVDDANEAEGEEQPTERFLRSRKFRDVVEEPRREKAPRRSRRVEEDDEDDESGAARDERNARKVTRKAEKARKEAAKEAEKKAVKARKAEQGTPMNLPEFISVATLAQALGVRYESFVSRLERLGYDDVFPGKVLNAETSGMIAMEYNFEPVFESAADEAEERDLKARPAVEDKEFLPTRPPVVTIMGHVDHGKTTILDYLRKSSVAAGEAGGITQHIGAFSVPLTSSGKTITFLDTPGHAAFLAMRQRGANVTDIVILVVAADDSVKPQTLEAIRHAKAAGVPMIVAVNKIDKEGADVQRVKQDLARHGVEIEDFGGDTQVVCVSGKTGAGMDELEEAAVTLSEILDHRAEIDGLVEGWVLEATTKKAGRVATVLVRRGTLKPGCVIVAGKTWARVRSLRNEAGVVVQEIGPGMPVEVDGWRDQPAAGDEVLQAPTEQKASDVVDFRLEKEEREKTAADMEAINEARRIEQEKREKEKLAARAKSSGAEDYFEAAAAEDYEPTVDHSAPTGRMEVPFIIKADVSGSAEAVAAYILSVSSPLIVPRILRSTVGALNESDVELAATAEGHIIAFNLPADEGMKGQAEARGVKVLENNIIYRVLDDVKAVLEDKLPAIVTQKVVGEAEISAAFEISVGGRKKMKIAGCKVRNGVINRGSRVRILRGEQKVFDGNIDSLKNVKKDVTEMRKGTECGMGFGEWEAFEVGDQVQTYEETSERRKL